ncbi:hypothetical protein [Winogradskyella helgolandensis]|nr:hypothetical protein [Winogradskyella helgolandensis]
MKLLQILKKPFFSTKPQQANLNTTHNEAQPNNRITRAFTKDEDTFMFI